MRCRWVALTLSTHRQWPSAAAMQRGVMSSKSVHSKPATGSAAAAAMSPWKPSFTMSPPRIQECDNHAPRLHARETSNVAIEEAVAVVYGIPAVLRSYSLVPRHKFSYPGADHTEKASIKIQPFCRVSRRWEALGYLAWDSMESITVMYYCIVYILLRWKARIIMTDSQAYPHGQVQK